VIKDVRRLEVAVDDPLLVRVLHGLADLHEQFEALGRAQALLVAIARERHPGHKLHREERTPALGHPGVQHPGDVGVGRECQCLPLRLEAGEHLPRVHPELDDLQRHHPPHRRPLLGLVNHPHAPLADAFEDPEGADHFGILVGRPYAGGMGGRRLAHLDRQIIMGFGHVG
jgi:hypothetical protein